MYVCSTCNSESVGVDAWVSINTDEVLATFDTVFCFDCECETIVKEA